MMVHVDRVHRGRRLRVCDQRGRADRRTRAEQAREQAATPDTAATRRAR